MLKCIVKTTAGQLKGEVRKLLNDKIYYSFKGIPYAKPPLNELRFAPPVDPEPWQGVRDAIKNCNICAQLNKETSQIVGDEDCLYLNVYTPCLPEPKTNPLLPVMVFIHGGGFVYGSGTDDKIHSPNHLIEKDVVVVSLNYRLGILGFLSVDCKEAPGNMGLKDQVQALKWVNKNIQNFNGDPSNVTIFGISAGGASVEFLLLTHMTKNLFHKAIAQSGSSINHWAQNNNIKELAAKIPVLKGKVITDNYELVKYLKTMPLKDLITSSMTVVANQQWKGGIHFGFVPTIEKEGDWDPFISRPPYEMLSEGTFNNVPFMSGYCRREGLLMLIEPFKPVLDRLVRDKDFLEPLPFDLDDTQKDHYANRLRTVYLEEEGLDEADSFAIDYFSDINFLGGIYKSSELISRKNSNVYMYEFAYDGGLNYVKKKLNITRKGACHGDDGGYLIKATNLQDNLSDCDKVVKERMCHLWTDFARYGKPTQISQINNMEGEDFWEPMSDKGFAILQMDETFKMKYDITERMKLMTKLYTKFYNKVIIQ